MPQELFYKELGDENSPNLIIIHGLYGSSDNWLTIARHLQDKFHIYIVDQRNHGQSPHIAEMNYDAMADDIQFFMKQHQIESSILMGHSMGGKTAMTVALKYPQLIDKLIILDIAPKSYGNFSNYAQITNDHRSIINALLSVQLEEHKSRTSVDKFLQVGIPNKMVRSFLLKNVGRNDNGTLFWKFNLQALADNLHLIMDGFSDKDYSEFPMDKTVVLINGANSPYVQEEDLQLVRHYFPSVQTATIPDAGHWLHAEQPEIFLKTLLYFIQ